MAIDRGARASHLILASGSTTRRDILLAAGLTFDVVPADIDEAELMAAMTAENDCVEAADIASALATAKALDVSRRHPAAVVIGADQVLVLGRRFFSKAADTDDARHTLETLRGRTHELVSSVVVVKQGAVCFETTDSAFLTMRSFSDAFLDGYIQNAGGVLMSSVGCYAIEGLGIQLFDHIHGDHFTVLGLPLLPLLAHLRQRGAIPE